MTPLERAREALMAEILRLQSEGVIRQVGEINLGVITRAVIEAIREPNEAMKMAGVIAPNYLEDQSSPRGCANIYAAMIDALLAEGGK